MMQGEGVHLLLPPDNFSVPHFCKFHEINHNEYPHVWGGRDFRGYAVAIVEKIFNWCRRVLYSTVFVPVSYIMLERIKIW